jgi:UDP-glucose 4-epimerase
MSKNAGTPHRVLITGGAGFIGHRVVRELLALSPENHVAVLDNLSVGMPMPSSSPRLTIREADIRDRTAVESLVDEFEPTTVVHLAAVHHIPTCEKRRAYALDVNVIGTETLLEVAEAKQIGRFILASSGAVYHWQHDPLQEDGTPLKPADNYSLAKHTNEAQVRFWADRTGSFARVARIFNTIGHDDPNAHLIPDIVSQIPAGVPAVEIGLGNLTPRRDYIHADDTARAIAELAVSNGGPRFDVFNVSTGVDVSVAELVRLLGEVMGVEISVREDPERVRRVDRPSQLGSTQKIMTTLGFVPRKSLRIALEEIVAHAGKKVIGNK